jgi:hypothetical protein
MSGQTNNPRYWLRRRAAKRTGYPAATLVFYGPDDTRASKAVLGIVPAERSTGFAELFKWFSDTTDLRTDPAAVREFLAVMDEHQVQRVVMLDRLFGCPHEEGIDYPEGEVCPQCPFWADRDRWTGLPL